MIVDVVRRYSPEWVPPADSGRDWIPCLCAFHDDTTKSAAVSYTYDAYRCLACDARGNSVTLIQNREGVSYRQAQRIHQEITSGSGENVPPSVSRKSRRELLEQPRSTDRGDRTVRARLRR